MIGIYKFENKITHQCYIGQSTDIKRRYLDHKRRSILGSSKFYKAIQQYGFDNFDFTILEECSEQDLDKKERYWINYYNSFENGYNSTTGGNQYCSKKLTNLQILELQHLLIKSKKSFEELANQFNISIRTIYDINNGTAFNNSNFIYPLRERKNKKIIHYCPECGSVITSRGRRCIKCSHEAQRTVERPSREQLKQLIRTTSFLSIGKQFNVSDNAVRKWCDSYHLPRKKEDIKNYSDEEWEKI